MSPGNKRAGERRLADMSGSAESDRWRPEAPEDAEPFEQWFPISAEAGYFQRFVHDQWGRLAEWAVIQMRRDGDGNWHKVAVYDACHGKGLHLHVYNRSGERAIETPIREVTSYDDFSAGLDYALERVVGEWRENERRSDREG